VADRGVSICAALKHRLFSLGSVQFSWIALGSSVGWLLLVSRDGIHLLRCDVYLRPLTFLTKRGPQSELLSGVGDVAYTALFKARYFQTLLAG